MSQMLWIPFVIFFAVLILSHLACRRWSKSLWSVIQYGWLTISAAGLIFAVAEVRKIDANTLLLESDWESRFLTSQITRDADFRSSLYLQFYDYENWTLNTEHIPYFKRAGQWYASLDTLAGTDRLREASTLLPIVEDSLQYYPVDLQKAMEATTDDIRRLLATYDTVDSAGESKEDTWYERLLKYLLAFLLPISFALQITKTTAERKGWIG